MFRDVQYVRDSSGTERAVQIPIASWRKHIAEFDKMKRKISFLNELKQSMREVKKMESGKMKKQTLDDFLREL